MNNKYFLSIGKNIQQFRMKKGLTQNELAEKMNTTQQAISLLEKDEVGSITLGKLVEVSEALQLSLGELLGIQGVSVNMENNQSHQPIAYNQGTIQIEIPNQLMVQYENHITDLKNQVVDLRELLKEAIKR